MRRPIYFANAAEFRRWLATNAATASEITVGFMKLGSKVPSMTWSQAVDEALCFGWIDGVRRRVDDERYTIRFTPRKPGSTWSAVNIAKMAALEAEGRLTPAGIAAFERRTEKKSRTYAYEQTAAPELSVGEVTALEKNRTAAAFFKAQPPSYRKQVTWWIVSAKREETRTKRFAALLHACADGKRL